MPLSNSGVRFGARLAPCIGTVYCNTIASIKVVFRRTNRIFYGLTVRSCNLLQLAMGIISVLLGLVLRDGISMKTRGKTKSSDLHFGS